MTSQRRRIGLSGLPIPSEALHALESPGYQKRKFRSNPQGGLHDCLLSETPAKSKPGIEHTLPLPNGHRLEGLVTKACPFPRLSTPGAESAQGNATNQGSEQLLSEEEMEGPESNPKAPKGHLPPSEKEVDGVQGTQLKQVLGSGSPGSWFSRQDLELDWKEMELSLTNDPRTQLGLQ